MPVTFICRTEGEIDSLWTNGERVVFSTKSTGTIGHPHTQTHTHTHTHTQWLLIHVIDWTASSTLNLNCWNPNPVPGHVTLFKGKALKEVAKMASLMAQAVECLPATQETWVRFLGWEYPLEKEMAIHSSTLAWKIPWTEEPDRLQSMGSQRVKRNWATSLQVKMRSLEAMTS